MTRLLAILPILTGCNGTEILSGHESPSKAHYERIALLTTPEKPEVATAVDVEEIIVPPKPVCVEVFRINRCVDGKITDWSHQP